jgi:hypothetical protein
VLRQFGAYCKGAGLEDLDRFKQRIREITRRAKGVSMETTMEELAPYMRGWRSYVGFCETPEVLIYLTRWVRLRLRAAMWRQWKTPRRRRAALLELGVRLRLASNTEKALEVSIPRLQLSADVLRFPVFPCFRVSYINQVANDLAKAPPARPLPRRILSRDPNHQPNTLASRRCARPVLPAVGGE